MSMVMGGETEYAISAVGTDGQPIPQASLLARVFSHAASTFDYSSLSTRGRFLTNGGLFYLDAGLHIEWATPETTSPFEVVRYLAAGDRIVERVAASFKAEHADVADVFCSRTNVDYVSRTLWAAHESYLHRSSLGTLRVELSPFLASRVVLGAGGWDCFAPGLRFTLSPRAHFISVPAERDSQYTRPLFNTKDEPHSTLGTHRLHVACGESLSSQVANVLRFGTTALVLAAVERGSRPGSAVTLADPVTAVQALAADPDLRAAVPLAEGGSMTALEIQRHYLNHVEAALTDRRLPWMEEVCALWRRTLDDLSAGGATAHQMLDWAIKRRLFQRCLSRHGVDWATLPAWDAVLRRVWRQWERDFGPERELSLSQLLEPSTYVKATMLRQQAACDSHGVSWSQLPALVKARQEVFELDARFGALGEGGVFTALDRAGALRHVVRDLDVEGAVEHPPTDTRARVRGEVVRRLSAAGIRYGAEWTSVHDRDGHRELDLGNPFEATERWRQLGTPREPPGESAPGGA